MADYITKQFCEKTNQAVMKEIKELQKMVFNLSMDFAKFPEILADKFDKRYAPIAIAEEIEEIKTRQDTNTTNIANRNYEWLKYLIMLGVGYVFSYLFNK